MRTIVAMLLVMLGAAVYAGQPAPDQDAKTPAQQVADAAEAKAEAEAKAAEAKADREAADAEENAQAAEKLAEKEAAAAEAKAKAAKEKAYNDELRRAHTEWCNARTVNANARLALSKAQTLAITTSDRLRRAEAAYNKIKEDGPKDPGQVVRAIK